METRKWVRNVGFATRAMLGAREQDRDCVEREVSGAGVENLENKEKKEVKSTSRVASEAKSKRGMWRRGIVPYPRKATRPKSRSMEKEWVVVG